MQKTFILLIILSLFFSISTVSAEGIISEDSIDIEVLNEERSLDSDIIFAEDRYTLNSNNASEDDLITDQYSTSSNSSSNGSSNNTNQSSVDSSKIPYKFSSTKNISSTYGKKVNFFVKVLNKDGKPINHTLVTFKVSSKTYNAYTDVNGISSIYLNFNAGKYTIKYNASGISGTNTYSVKNYYKITLYKWKSGANVLKNKRIKANVPKSSIVRKMIKLAKSGTPVIKFKGGNGKKVFITAGVHGNELPSQVAAMKFIKYLQTHSVNGTVYVMPFMNPKCTAANVRDYNGVRLNKEANKKGTISYKTVRLIKKLKCDAYGDFHATRPGGKPGKDLAFGTYRPTKESAVIAKYISKYAKVKYKIYKKAGSEYPGALEDEVNIKGIPAVTCEVLSPHGKIKKGSVNKSLLMMKTLLRYVEII